MAKNPTTKNEASELEKVPTNTALASFNYGEDAGLGFENQGAADRVVPFLNVLQGLSPQCKKEPFRPGMLFNTATEQHWQGADGLVFVACLTTHSFLEYAPRKSGGGFKGKHTPESKVVADAKRACEDRGGDFGDWWTGEPEKSNELTEAFEVYGVICDSSGETQPAIIPFTGMKIKRYKAWMTKLATVQVPIRNAEGVVVKKISVPEIPLFAFLSRIRTVEEKNAKGEYFNLVITPEHGDWFNEKDPKKSSLLGRSDHRYQAAKSFRELIVAGSIKVNYDAAQESGGGSSGGGKSDEEVPF